MRIIFLCLLCSIGLQLRAQVASLEFSARQFAVMEIPVENAPVHPTEVKKWKMNGNKYWTGGLIFLAGAARGFNEGLQFQYNGFAKIFPDANKQWFYPAHSFRNKYKDGDPAKGPKFPLSTTVLVFLTDQYHLNNFIQRASITGALVIKLGEGKRPLKHYLLDFAYYTVCYQAGFHSVYTPIRIRNRRK